MKIESSVLTAERRAACTYWFMVFVGALSCTSCSGQGVPGDCGDGNSRNAPCSPSAECGNGVVETGEACDDGNSANGDGCSALCELDDDQSTPGDDRPGYYTCHSFIDASTAVCAPGVVCCQDSAALCDNSCPSALDTATCDGPEDCVGTGSPHCVYGTHGTSCGTYPVRGVYCHRDADCVQLAPWLLDGTCGADGLCENSSAPSLP